MQCRVCGAKSAPFMSFGKMPLANGFLYDSDKSDEYFFELKPVFCSNCFTFQIAEQPKPELMFHENYAFFSRTSEKMYKHFHDLSEYIKSSIMPTKDGFLVELGSNDGIFLEHFAKDGYKHLGVEPSKNVSDDARNRGINTLNKFFNLETAKDIEKQYGQCDVIMAANVMCHIPNVNEIAEAANFLIKNEGFLIFEDPYLGSMIEKVSYDQLYDEHVFMFSLHSVENIFGRYGFILHDAQYLQTHGGSMRYILKKTSEKKLGARVKFLKEKEEEFGLNKEQTYLEFAKKCEASKLKLLKKLTEMRALGKRVVGYGATSKSTTILNYCNIGPDLIEFISDTTPIKQNKLSPGKHIPVLPYSYFDENPADVVVIFAWNHFQEILEKENLKRDFPIEWISHIDLKYIYSGENHDSFIESSD